MIINSHDDFIHCPILSLNKSSTTSVLLNHKWIGFEGKLSPPQVNLDLGNLLLFDNGEHICLFS